MPDDLGVPSASDRNEYQGVSLGAKCGRYVELTNVAVPFMPNVKVREETQHSIPLLSFRDFLHESCRVKTECDSTRAETRFGFPAKRTSPFISAGVSVQSAAGSRGVCISGSNAG